MEKTLLPPLYSIVVPHYDDIERLERLLESTPASREDIELIVVDDCSPNQASLAAARARWPMARWLSTEKNAGAGVARNVGLEAARGRWLVFADSDDEFISGAFETFDKTLRADDELVYFLAEAVQEVDGQPSVRAERMNELVVDYARSQNAESLHKLRLQHVVPWAKIYSRVFVEMHQLRFDPVRRSNDIAFNVLAAVQAHQVRAETAHVYRVFRRSGSLTTDATREDLLGRLKVLGLLNDRLREQGARERMHAASYIARAVPFGPNTLIAVFRLMLQHNMFGATLRRLGPCEVFRFLRRQRRDEIERRRLSGPGGADNVRGK